MATADFYRDERPQDTTTPGNWHPGGGAGGGGGGAGGGGGIWHPVDESDWHQIGEWGLADDALILVNGENLILSDGVFLLRGPCCMKLAIEVQIKGEHLDHLDCILLGAIVGDERFGAGNTIVADFIKNARIDIYARWQKGHWDVSEINTVRFRLQGDESTVTPWYVLPMGDAPGKRVMSIALRDGILRVSENG